VDANAPCIACTEPDFPRVGLMVPGESEGAGDDD
jgi:Ni,Fe-hydrogenase I small subunit